MNKLPQLGWADFFASQCTESELKQYMPARAFSMQKEMLYLKTAECEYALPLSGSMRAADPFIVGDWFLFDENAHKIIRRLNRKSLFKRVTSAKHLYVQLSGANIDTLFIVTSCNQDFNLNRIERYLTLASDAGSDAIVVITKSDLCGDMEIYESTLKELGDVPHIFINALDAQNIAPLYKWCKQGKTIALMGSSGVGKSTIVNTLLGGDVQKTGGIREDDAKGRHTTTHRSLHILTKGGILLDSPGIRELQLLANTEAVDDVFRDITALAGECKFRNCAHDKEVGCAVQQAIMEGRISQRRFDNYTKLRFEAMRATEMLDRRLKSERQGRGYQKSNKVKYQR